MASSRTSFCVENMWLLKIVYELAGGGGFTGCPGGTTASIINGALQICNGATPCTIPGYSCLSGFCCTTAAALANVSQPTTSTGACPGGGKPYIDASAGPRMCGPNMINMCPMGFGCQQTSPTAGVCCTGGASVERAPPMQSPTSAAAVAGPPPGSQCSLQCMPLINTMYSVCQRR